MKTIGKPIMYMLASLNKVILLLLLIKFSWEGGGRELPLPCSRTVEIVPIYKLITGEGVIAFLKVQTQRTRFDNATRFFDFH
jgi:hypothetical protein